MAHKKGGGSTRNGRGSNAQYRGVKVYGGEEVRAGGILVRQVGQTIKSARTIMVSGADFLALLLRCHKLVRQKGGELVLCGASPLARELLQITNLDTLWAIYDARDEALEAIGA